MAKKRRTVQKPVSRGLDPDPIEDADDKKMETATERVTTELDKIAEMLRTDEIFQESNNSGFINKIVEQGNSNWAKEVEDEIASETDQIHFQESSISHWKSFKEEKLVYRDPKLKFTEPIMKNGIKVSQLDLEEVKEEAASWSSAVICMVLGANPPMAVFEGFIKRIWGHLGITQIVKMTRGLICQKGETKKKQQEMKGKDSTQTSVQEQETKEENKQDEATAPRKLDSKEKNVTRAQNIDWITLRKNFSQKHLKEAEKLNDIRRNSVNSFMALGGDEGGQIVDKVSEEEGEPGRTTLWADLKDLKHPVKPWLILGDFNALFSLEDRTGGNPPCLSELVDSQSLFAQAHVEASKRTGSDFTWTNNQDGTSRIYSKIDHVFANEDWHDTFRNTSAHYGWETTSDHWSCVVSIKADMKIGVKPFLFYNFWADHPNFKGLVLQSWEKSLTTSGMKGIYLKLMRLKHVLKKFNHETIGDIGFMGTRNDTAARLNMESFDSNSRLNLDQQILLLKPFSNKEIKKAMFSIPDSKSPGPEWFNFGFFKVMWADIGKEVCKAISDFIITGFMPAELHSSMISLISKHDNPTKAVDFRPIACCSTLYKCVSKLLYSRLAKVLPSITNQNQGAFVQGRSIAHNVMILQDLLKNYNRKNFSPRCAIKINISKAYNTMNWDFIESLLAAFNLPQRFIKWLMTCITTTSYSIIMKGRIQGRFKGEKGLRQGDPLSPLLFVLVMEYLTRLLQLAASNSNYRFHPLCKKLRLINLCFADDLIIFSKCSQQSIATLKHVLEEFSKASGLHINHDKSQIFLGGVNPLNKQSILEELKLVEGKFPMKYLRIPLHPTKWKAEDCGIIIKKITQRLHNWASKHLSFAGKI
uniref:Reverse transcriptase domain-containing protein n=1 Tax=Cannabis sativa TaxID=3483 RepID=A0A803PTS1_CANSA